MSARVGIAGLGLIGGSLLRGFAGQGRDVAGFDVDGAVRERAAGEGYAVANSLADLAAGSDVVFVAVPPRAVAGAVAEALRAAPGAVVADATSAKQGIVEEVAAAVVPPDFGRFVPAHPLAGAESSGWDASSEELLRGAFWAICPPGDEDARPEPVCAVADVLDDLDSRLIVCTPEDHDDALARTSHVPHVAAQALVHLAGDGDVPLRAALSGGGYRDATRIAESDPGLWADILAANSASTRAGLDALIDELGALRDAIAAGDRDRIATAWDEGRELRHVVERVRWSEPAWEAERVRWPAWGTLLELGRSGRAVRRLHMARDGALEFEAVR